MSSALFVFLVSVATMQGYVDSAVDNVGLGRPITLQVTSNTDPTGPSLSRGWVSSNSPNHVFIREWALEASDAAFGYFFAAHEICHLKLGHTKIRDPTQTYRIEREADQCVRNTVSTAEWKRILISIDYMNVVQRRLKLPVVLSSP